MLKDLRRGSSQALPDFADEAEERAYWDTHDPSEYFTEPSDLIIQLKSTRKRMVSVRLDEALHDELKAVAARHGLPYQRLMRELLRQALANLARTEGRPANS